MINLRVESASIFEIGSLASNSSRFPAILSEAGQAAKPPSHPYQPARDWPMFYELIHEPKIGLIHLETLIQYWVYSFWCPFLGNIMCYIYIQCYTYIYDKYVIYNYNIYIYMYIYKYKSNIIYKYVCVCLLF